MITSSSSSHGSERIMEKAQRDVSQPVWRFLAGLRKLDLRVSSEKGRLRVSAPPGVLTAELCEELAAGKAEILDFLRESRILNGDDGPLLHPGPGYPFERQRYWIERPSEPESAAEAPAPMAPQKLAVQDWGAVPVATESSSASRASRPARPIMGARTECEEQIVDLWRQVLGVEEVDIRENFLELGGNSLMAVQLSVNICALTWSFSIPPERRFHLPKDRSSSRWPSIDSIKAAHFLELRSPVGAPFRAWQPWG